MRILILGAGVVGVTTAYYLARDGHKVTVIDRGNDVAGGTSFANGGQLSYSFTDSLAKPDFLAQMPRVLAGRDPGSLLRIDRALLGWGLRFLAQCRTGRAQQNTLALLDIAMRSAELMVSLRETAGIDFRHRDAGKLILLADDAELASARASRELKLTRGCVTELLTPVEATTIEPALAALDDTFIAAVYSRGDHVADAQLFTARLRAHLEATTATEFLFDAEVCAIRAANDGFSHLEFADRSLSADALVVCAGPQSAALVRPLGIRLPIYPVRGYSVTLPTAAASPSVSITALRRRLLFSRLGDNMRIAGFADFVGGSNRADDKRIAELLTLAGRIAPDAADYGTKDTQAWAADRPMTPDGRPFVGPTNIPGLLLNTGHGMLGFTLANACAEQVARCCDARAS